MSEKPPKEQCEALMREVLPLAKRMLVEDGEFYPYGAVLNEDGTITHVGARQEGEDHPKSKTLINILTAKFQEDAGGGRIRASAIVCGVLIKPPGGLDKVDAIQVNLDHQSGYSVDVLFPYSFRNGRIGYGEPFAQKGEHRIFSE